MRILDLIKRLKLGLTKELIYNENDIEFWTSEALFIDAKEIPYSSITDVSYEQKNEKCTAKAAAYIRIDKHVNGLIVITFDSLNGARKFCYKLNYHINIYASGDREISLQAM